MSNSLDPDEMAHNSLDPDETAHYEPSHLDLCCLKKLLLSPVALKELMTNSADPDQLASSEAN